LQHDDDDDDDAGEANTRRQKLFAAERGRRLFFLVLLANLMPMFLLFLSCLGKGAVMRGLLGRCKLFSFTLVQRN
jgi:hypothetical protein